MKSTLQNDPVLRFFKETIMARLGNHLRQVMLFGSRARGDATAESDYDLLVVVDQIDSSLTKWIDAIAGQALIEHGAVLSAFPITELDRIQQMFYQGRAVTFRFRGEGSKVVPGTPDG